ncbi:PEP-CTERM sorting domain-containing protein [Caldimonas brevitalea]|uniref:PEP-CTERM protein-sorting domain-containing protein n=1 Tax=Caldimonas brevitalea TaxID=413882 RepID=A0A0G3BX68_9BURK|nr:PEP-CTERM sorting domain-containing protein [Caldimonas brevitalea]AKJ31961.1 hypothetical protein AAW51_5270 [Caldimonas brevitalea]
MGKKRFVEGWARAMLLPLLFLLHPSASAALTVYRSVDTYLAATGGLHDLITFEGGPAPGIAVPGDRFSDDMRFESCSKPGGDCWLGDPKVTWFDNAIASPPQGTQFRIVTGALVSADPNRPTSTNFMALGIYGDTTTAGVDISFLGNSLDTFRLQGETGFFGMVSDEPFDTFAVVQAGHHEDVAPFFINGVAISSPSGAASFDWPPPPIPEPSSSSLLLGGAAILLLVLRRSTRRSRFGA